MSTLLKKLNHQGPVSHEHPIGLGTNPVGPRNSSDCGNGQCDDCYGGGARYCDCV